jgi:hypothetical protein
MANDPRHAHVEVQEHGRMVASGEIERTSEDDTRVSVHRESGHLPVGTSARLIDAVLDHPEVKGAGHMTAALPRGDDEALNRVQELCDKVETRPAGASIMVEADTPAAAPAT